jgi:hypothetical protein
MDLLHATTEEFAADGYTHIERCRLMGHRAIGGKAMRQTILIALALSCGEVTTKANPTEPFPTFTDGNQLFDACEGFRTQGASG